MNSNVSKFERPLAAQEQAGDWVARIDAGPLSAEERRELQQWLAQHPDHARLLDECALLWSKASHASFPQAAADADQTAPQAWQRRSRWTWIGSALGAGALAVLAWVVVPLAMDPGTGLNQSTVHATAIAVPEAVALPDGSKTELNAASTLRVAYSAGRRRVLLDRGEGLFEVAKDKTRPFEVVADHTIVRAVGTRFLVQRHADGRVEVTVYEGVVEVRKTAVADAANTQPIRLGAGQMAVSAATQTLVALSQPQAMTRKLAWMQGRIECDHTALADAVEVVNRYSAIPIKLGNVGPRPIEISGSFSTRDTAVFLRSLEEGFGLRVQRSGDAWVLDRPEAS